MFVQMRKSDFSGKCHPAKHTQPNEQIGGEVSAPSTSCPCTVHRLLNLLSGPAGTLLIPSYPCSGCLFQDCLQTLENIPLLFPILPNLQLFKLNVIWEIDLIPEVAVNVPFRSAAAGSITA